ncbi:MAG: AsmA family protein [Magnetospirillum sp.]|nr:AsmA family protein [Magnetospirillum sp.]
MSTVLNVGAGAAVAVTVGLIAVAKSIDFDRYKGFVAQQVKDATGREMTIAGPLQLKLGLTPQVVATGIGFANVPRGSRKEMVTVERFEAEVALLPLLRREIQVRRLLLVKPDLLLETDATGRGNWQFAAAPAVDHPAEGSPPTRFDIGELRLQDARVTWHDGASGKTTALRVDTASVIPETAGGPLAVRLAGEWHGAPLAVDAALGALSTIAAGKPWPLRVTASLGTARALVDGSIAQPLAGRGLDLKLDLQGDEAATLAGLAGIAPLPAIGPFRLSAQLGDPEGGVSLSNLELAVGRRDTALLSAKGSVRNALAPAGVDLAVTMEADSLAGLSGLAGTALPPGGPLRLSGRLHDVAAVWRLDDLDLKLAGSAANGALAVTPGRVPRLEGTLAAATLSLADITAPAARPGESQGGRTALRPAASADRRLFSADPLPLAALRGFAADIAFSAARVQAGAVPLTQVGGRLAVADGRLRLAPMTAMLAGGKVEGEFALDASGRTALLTARLSAADVEMGRMFGDALSGGRTRARLDLRGRGESVRQAMAGLNGEAMADIGPGQVRNRAVDWAGGDLALQVLGALNPLAKAEETSRLDCAAVHFAIKDGLAVADRGIAVETAKVNVVGAGTVDLRSERLDLGITAKARDGIGLNLGGMLSQMTRIRGTLAAPEIGVDEAGAVRTAASVGAAGAPPGLSNVGELLYDKASADPHPCRTALGKAPRKGTRSPGLLDGLFGR